ncbi:hypothetical protein BH23PAT2_BH23PAT2_01140 [soil metagenome]
MFKKLLNQTFSQKHEQRKAELYRNLIRHEAKIGGSLFGEVKPGGRREFFCLDEHTWVWHEEWIANGQRKVRTTRYDVRPDRVLKFQDGQYRSVENKEALHLYDATQAYKTTVKEQLYANSYA